MTLLWQRLSGRSGHEAAWELAASHFGGNLPEIIRTPQGKPLFAQGNLHISISHTKNHAFCAIASYNIGIDAEEIGRPVRAVARYCSPKEIARAEGAQDPGDAYLRLWVLKEAYGKFTGKGLGDSLKNTDFSPDDPNIQIIDGCYVAICTGDNHAL